MMRNVEPGCKILFVGTKWWQPDSRVSAKTVLGFGITAARPRGPYFFHKSGSWRHRLWIEDMQWVEKGRGGVSLEELGIRMKFPPPRFFQDRRGLADRVIIELRRRKRIPTAGEVELPGQRSRRAKGPDTTTSNIQGSDTDPLSVGGGGGGFGDPEQNARVERAAVSAVKRDYRARGWAVQSKESEKVGYDLLCSRGSVVQHVEVKGISGPVCSFPITAKEKKRAEDDPAFRLIAMTNALKANRRELSKFRGSEFLRKFRFAPTNFMARLGKAAAQGLATASHA